MKLCFLSFFYLFFVKLTHKIQQMFDGLSFQNKAIKTSIKKIILPFYSFNENNNSLALLIIFLFILYSNIFYCEILQYYFFTLMLRWYSISNFIFSL